MAKILLCDNGLPGLVRFRYDVIEHFVEREDEVLLIYPKCTESMEWYDKLPQKVKTIPLKYNPSSINPLNDAIFLWNLTKIYYREKPDICIHYTIKPNIYGSIAARICGIKNIALVAGLGYMFQDNNLLKKTGRLLYKIGLKNANVVITLNNSIRKILVEKGFVNKEKIVLFKGGEGVNFNRYPYFVQKYDEPVRFLTVARVFYDKGYSEFVEAAKLVHKKYPDIIFEWLGDYDERSPMTVPQNILNADVNAGHIKYLGTTDNILNYLHRDGICICLPSYHEGLSKSLMEACSIGLPIIASNIPGCQECVDSGINGYLVEKKDSMSLAQAMINFIELDKEIKCEMAASSYKKALETFDVRNVLSEYDRIINELRK